MRKGLKQKPQIDRQQILEYPQDLLPVDAEFKVRRSCSSRHQTDNRQRFIATEILLSLMREKFT